MRYTATARSGESTLRADFTSKKRAATAIALDAINALVTAFNLPIVGIHLKRIQGIVSLDFRIDRAIYNVSIGVA